jgi:hypothetical protein
VRLVLKVRHMMRFDITCPLVSLVGMLIWRSDPDCCACTISTTKTYGLSTSTRQHQNHLAIYDYSAQKRKFRQTPTLTGHHAGAKKKAAKNPTRAWKERAKSRGIALQSRGRTRPTLHTCPTEASRDHCCLAHQQMPRLIRKRIAFLLSLTSITALFLLKETLIRR